MSDAEILQRFIGLVLRLYEVDIDAGVLRYKSANKYHDIGDIAGSYSGAGYLRVKVLGQPFYIHRIIWLIAKGRWPDELDHIDGNKTYNSINNLREVTHSENHQNKALQSNNKSGYAGVHKVRDKELWAARIKVLGKTHHLGKFKTLEAAVSARGAAEQLLHPFRRQK